jgi:hypothetical protein
MFMLLLMPPSLAAIKAISSADDSALGIAADFLESFELG